MFKFVARLMYKFLGPSNKRHPGDDLLAKHVAANDATHSVQTEIDKHEVIFEKRDNVVRMNDHVEWEFHKK